ncbi:collagen alpha-2(I) chain-like, partial [Passer montanus]|uniref:collagen alpha-2(I) chain-like n=1 Tax=Passer montanus TaxID=9160 RepID=UPI001961F508
GASRLQCGNAERRRARLAGSHTKRGSPLPLSAWLCLLRPLPAAGRDFFPSPPPLLRPPPFSPFCATCAPWERPLAQSRSGRGRSASARPAQVQAGGAGERAVRARGSSRRRPSAALHAGSREGGTQPESGARRSAWKVESARVGRAEGRAGARARAGPGDITLAELPGRPRVLGLRQRARRRLLLLLLLFSSLSPRSAPARPPPAPPARSGRGRGWCQQQQQQRRERSSGRHFTPAPAAALPGHTAAGARNGGSASARRAATRAPRDPSHTAVLTPQTHTGQGGGALAGWERAGWQSGLRRRRAGGARWGPAALWGRGAARWVEELLALPSWPPLSGGRGAAGPVRGPGVAAAAEAPPEPGRRGARGSRLIVPPAPPLHSLPVRGRGRAAASVPGVCAGSGAARVRRGPGHVGRRWAMGSGVSWLGNGALHCSGRQCGREAAAGPGGSASSGPGGEIGPGVLQPALRGE